MTEIKISQNQGITQAIASNLNMSAADCKKVKLSVWQEVMNLVKQNNARNVSTGTKSDYSGTSDVSKINDKSSYSTNFLVHADQSLHIEDSIMDKIKQLLTGNSNKANQSDPIASNNNVNRTSATASQQNAQSTTPTLQSSASEANILADIPVEGSAEAGQTVNSLLNKMGMAEDVKISVISDETSALMSKKNLTPEERTQMLNELHNGMKKLGNSMTKYITSEYGNGSETISPEAFLKWQAAGRTEDAKANNITYSAEDEQKFAQDDMVLFNRLDLNKDGKIDNEEMSSFFFAMDFDEQNKSNGAIDTITFGANMNLASSPDKNILDQKLTYAYKALYGKNTAE